MGKNPSFPFYPSDWTRDLDDQDLEVEGAWIRICCRLWWADKCGEMTKPIKEWSRILRKTEQKTIKILQILIEKGIASGEVLVNQSATIINRRMVRSAEISQIRHKVGSLGGNPNLMKTKNNLDNQNPNQKPTPSSSSSSSSSKSKKPKIIYTDDFLSFWKIYPRKEGKDAAQKAWNNLNGIRPELDALLKILETQNKNIFADRETKYIPLASTWLNGHRWEDEVDLSDSFEAVAARFIERQKLREETENVM
jgi:hypothetical protein